MKRRIPAVAAVMVTICALVSPSRAEMRGALQGDVMDHGVLDAFLKRHVKPGGLVDYLSVRRPEHLAELQKYLDAAEKVDDLALPPDERLALYCNLYNAVMIKVMAGRYRVGLLASEDNFRIFKEPVFKLGGEKPRWLSLYDLEHDLIRKQVPDPRIHAAIVCGAMDCPELIPEAYTASRVREQLQDRMTRWLNSPVHTPVDREAKVVRPSGLFLTYAVDFGGREKVEDYIRGFLPAEVRGFRIEFRKAYDWTPNMAAPGDGRYVYVTAPVAKLFEEGGELSTRVGLGAVLRVLDEVDGGWKVEHPRRAGVAVVIGAEDVAEYPPAAVKKEGK
jgi:hypothetical protein